MNFDSHMDGVVATAVALVNVCTPGTARGHTCAVPVGEDLKAEVESALARGSRTPGVPTTADVAELARLAARLRTVFAHIDRGELDSAAGTVNELLVESRAVPWLERHDGQPWHLHFHGPDSTLARGWAAGCATGLAVVIGSEYADRLGVCGATGCDRVYVDTSRNGNKRFCSTACQSRAKTAAFRARHARPSAGS